MSNILAAAVFFEGGRRQLSGATPVPDMWRGAAVVYMAVTYIVFAVLLRDLQDQLQTNVPWVDSVLHRVMPIAAIADWLIDPPRTAITFRRAVGAWIGFPLAWTAFTLIRGEIDGRYPYPFWIRPTAGTVRWRCTASPSSPCSWPSSGPRHPLAPHPHTAPRLKVRSST